MQAYKYPACVGHLPPLGGVYVAWSRRRSSPEYIGATRCFQSRIGSHSSFFSANGVSRIVLLPCSTKKQRFKLELALIGHLAPLHNRNGNMSNFYRLYNRRVALAKKEKVA